MKSTSNSRPLVLHDLGDGSWHYNYHIKEVQIADEESEEERTVFEYETVHFSGSPTYEKIVSSIIRENYDVDAEFSIQRQRESKPENFSKYNAFCEETKAMVKNDLTHFAAPHPLKS